MAKKQLAAIDGTTARVAKRRRFGEEFKREAVRLVTEQKYTLKAAAEAVGVSEKSLRQWHVKWAPPRPGPARILRGCGKLGGLAPGVLMRY